MGHRDNEGTWLLAWRCRAGTRAWGRVPPAPQRCHLTLWVPGATLLALQAGRRCPLPAASTSARRT